LLTVWSASCAALLLVPTRELALQTSQVCKELGKHMGVQVNKMHWPKRLQMPSADFCVHVIQLAMDNMDDV
jgi:superfamily II DNA/RNA helicase